MNEGPWHGVPKAGEPELNVEEIEEKINEALKPLSEAIQKGLETIVINAAIALLQKQIEKYVLERERVHPSGSWHSTLTTRYFELSHLIDAYEIVENDLRRIRDDA